MPRYYFHIRENDVLDMDDTGVELESLEQAYQQARRAALEMKLAELHTIDGRVFEITTRDGLVLKEVAFEEVLELD